ncbi:MAG TPA: patatin-like phospholipase family protein [Candidatus Cloacimonadota bacterium]|nr:patatin-like phospholipase family protein [Candidatus Cloacimonadota bacterium]
MKKKAKLILGGGSAYGLAHIGVLAAVEEEFEITGIVGTSMGAIVGALYSQGLGIAGILDCAQNFNRSELFNPLNLDITLSGIYDGKATLKQFRNWTGAKDISTGRIPYIAVAYDLLKSCSVLIDKGQYADAMRASSSLPYVFAPYAYDHYLFVDGGVEHPLPVAFGDRVPGEICIAVNVLPPVSLKAETIVLKGSKARARIRSHQVFLQSILQNQGFVAIESLINHPPDIVIDAYDPGSSVLDLSKAQRFYDFGYAKATRALADHKKPDFTSQLIKGYQKLLSRIKFKLES